MKKDLTFNGDDTAMATFLLSVMGAFAGFERALIHERQREAIGRAKKAGAYKGRSKALNDEQPAEIAKHAAAGEAKAALAREFGVSLQTIYEYRQASSRSNTPRDAPGSLSRHCNTA